MAGIRLGGLASGIDTETMIKQMMQAERAPVDRLSQKKQTLTWQRDAYREMNRGLLDFRMATSDMLLAKNYTAKTAVSSDISKIIVTASPVATVGSITIDSVTQLASASSLVISRNTSLSGTVSSQTKLDASGLIGKDEVGNMELQLMTYQADGTTGATVTMKFDGTATVSDLVVKINNDKSLGLNAVFNDITGKLVLTRQTTGKLAANDEIVWTDKNQIIDKTIEPVKTETAGKNAIYSIGGTELEQKNNTFTQNGLTITLNGISNVATTITTKLDTQANFDSIKKFIDKYNDLIDKMNKKVREEKYRDYLPLTDSQRKELSEEEVKKWEEKAMSGVLKNDSLLREGIDSFRSTISSKIDTGYSYTSGNEVIKLQYMSQIGITSTSDFRDGGKLKIDETKLKKMLEEQPEGVYKLFTIDAPDPVKNPDGSVSPNLDGVDGFLRQILGFATTARDKISKVAGLDGSATTTYRLGKSLTDINKSMLTWEDKLKTKEDSYYRRFAAMEKAMNQANSQSISLASYLGQ